jgi:hypothetical protein
LILARIQGHPSRAHLHADLIRALSLLPTELRVHSSEPPDPWAGYRACLSDLPRNCTHVLVCQDDALPCRNFAQAVEQIAGSHPEVPVCLFLGGLPSETAARASRALGKKTYVPLGMTPFVPLVCVLWPKLKAQSFLHWSRSARGITRADDGNAAKWMRRSKQEVLVTVPSLVEHSDAPSVKGQRPCTGKWCSALFLAEDALDYEW